MPFDHLGEFVSRLQDAGQLRRVPAELDPDSEAAALTQRVAGPRGDGPALLCERIQGSPLPLAVNLLGSAARIELALGAALDDVAERWNRVLRTEASESWLQRLKLAAQTGEATLAAPQVVKSGMCQQVVRIGRDVDAAELPALRCGAAEGARGLTGGLVFTREPGTERRCVDRLTLQVRDRQAFALCGHEHQAVFRNLAAHRPRGVPLPAAVVFGGDPLLGLLPGAALPGPVDQLMFAGFLRGKSLELVRGRQIDLEVPAQAEVVIEGYIDPAEPLEPAGPWLTEGGDYAAARPVPTFRIACVTHRGNPLMTGLVGGTPPHAATWLEAALDRLALPLLQWHQPQVRDYQAPPEWGGRVGVVQIQKQIAGAGRQTLHALWGWPRTFRTKLLVVVDDDVDPRRPEAVWQAVAARLDPARDVVACESPGDAGEAATSGLTSKLGLDATRKWPGERRGGDPPAPFVPDPAWQTHLERRWAEYRLP